MADEVYYHPVSSYTSVDRLLDEKQKLFRQFPILVGFSNDLAAPGDYLTETYVGIPVLLIRGADGGLKAFLNMCSHRATQVAEGCGKGARRFVCPYHGWTFDANGKFVGMPGEEGFTSIDKTRLNLTPLPVQEKYGLIWLVLSEGPAFDIDDHLQELKADFAAYGYENYHHYKTFVVYQAMNWKLVIDTFLENYHLQVLHRKSIAGAIHSHLQLVDAQGNCQRLVQARRTFDDIRTLPESEWNVIKHTAIAYVLFPNTLFIMQSDHVEIWRSFPDGDDPNRSKIYFDVYVPEPAVTEKAMRYWDKNIEYGKAVVLAEDFPLGERNQASFRSGARDNLLFGRNEPGLMNYHEAIRRVLQEAGAEPWRKTSAAWPRQASQS